ncbi:helix-turn-helix transcriptional regulator [Actinoplanes solisilvae]|uniref:helix-turn-helix transcriptional regulator n=1 Tax=Actinoplanes solisilvae TaxID=2486853 RepID=UPI000FD74C1C|nr:helix-turn-helix transcriptional regulator [Actinoplanes solisilvae]
MLLARAQEMGRLDRLVEDVRLGTGRALVVRGEPGIGKTTLLDHLAERAKGCQVVRIVGIQSEIELAYAALHQLCDPLMDRLGDLPEPQREALATTFGLQPGPFPNPFLVRLATLSLLSVAAEDEPLLYIVDDAQWLDRESAQVLLFVARRLAAEPVGMVFGWRTPSPDIGFDLIESLPLAGLGNKDASALLRATVQGPIDPRALSRIVLETGGNPLAIVEAARVLTQAEITSGIIHSALARQPGEVERGFAARFAGLPDDTRRLLLIAAAEPFADPWLVWGAAARLGLTLDALTPAIAAGLCEGGTVVRFTHPLVRSAVYYASTDDDRRTVHRALAEATGTEVDPDRHAWHRARAARTVDEDAAAGLAAAAERLLARGGPATAATLLRDAVELTEQPELRGAWLLRVARAELLAGDFGAALAALAAARAATLTESGVVHADLLEAEIAFTADRGNRATPLLLRAADQLVPLDPALARDTYLGAFNAALVAGPLSGGTGLREVAQRTAAAALPTPVAPHERLLDAMVTLWSQGRGEAAGPFRDALAAFRAEPQDHSVRARWLWLACVMSIVTWDDDAWYALSERQLDEARAAGDLAELPLALTSRIFAHLFTGELRTASLLAEEANAVTEATGQQIGPYAALGIAAFSGSESDLRTLVDSSLGDARARGESSAAGLIHWACAIGFNGHGHFEQAYESASAARAYYDEFDAGRVWAATELVEAACATGRRDVARAELQRVTESAEAAGTNWALGVAARLRGLLGDGEPDFREAIERLRQTRCRPDLARAHLQLGEHLRKSRRVGEARTELRTAHEAFTEMGMAAFAARAATGLRALGSPVRAGRNDGHEHGLTRQEARIARLAGSGLSNPEIAGRLFLSPRTVEYHLHKVFVKLRISSRAQLTGSIAET